MKKTLMVIGLMGVLVLGFYGCKEPSSTRSQTTTKRVEARQEKKVENVYQSTQQYFHHAPQEKQIVNFNQSTRKDIHITGGPPADRKISGMDGFRLE